LRGPMSWHQISRQFCCSRWQCGRGAKLDFLLALVDLSPRPPPETSPSPGLQTVPLNRPAGFPRMIYPVCHDGLSLPQEDCAGKAFEMFSSSHVRSIGRGEHEPQFTLPGIVYEVLDNLFFPGWRRERAGPSKPTWPSLVDRTLIRNPPRG